MQLTETRTKNAERKLWNLAARYNKKGLGFLRKNNKTIISMDKRNECPRESTETPCAYCYKGDIYKRLGKAGFEQGKVYHCSDTFNETLLREFCREYRKILKQYNIDFSIRLFSMGDYMQEHKVFWCNVLTVMKEEGVKIHAVTKQYDIIGEIADLLVCINLSVDTIHEQNSFKAAVEAKKTLELYTRVKIRCMAKDTADFEYFKNKVDIITIYHGNNLSRTMPEIETYTVKGKAYTKLVNDLDNGKVCCTKRTCTNCKRCQ